MESDPAVVGVLNPTTLTGTPSFKVAKTRNEAITDNEAKITFDFTSNIQF